MKGVGSSNSFYLSKRREVKGGAELVTISASQVWSKIEKFWRKTTPAGITQRFSYWV